MDSILKFNEKQTQLDDEMLEALPADVRDEFLTHITGVPFIANMVSPTRKRAKDLPRGTDGRIEVDVVNPHILEDMDYFREMAIHFEKHGCYTKLRPNGNPNSEYMKLWRREIKRIWEGMTRESDGEWIPGTLYFYWNYARIMFSEVIEGTDKANRVESFPEPWDSTYLWAHYIHQAMYGGKYNKYKGGNNFGVIARRGVGKSFFFASILCRAFMCGENRRVRENIECFLFAYDKQYLDKGGTLNKFLFMFNFLAKNTQFPHLLLKTQENAMHWVLGYQFKDGKPGGVRNEVTGVSVKDDPDKVRGKRGVYTLFEEFGSFRNFLKTYDTAVHNAKEGGVSFGSIGVVGTGGTQGENFSGALEMIYHPKGYNMYAVPNVFEVGNGIQGTSMMFLGAYMNRKLYYDKDGNSNVVGAMLEVMMEIYQKKLYTTDPSTVTQAKAENPMTMQECVMRVDVKFYPTADLNVRLNQLMGDERCFDDIMVGRLDMDGGSVKFVPTEDRPIRQYPLKDNRSEGAVEIYAMPEKNPSTNRVFDQRYLLGCDPYDNDQAESMSLGSVLVLDAFTDEIVAEYTGRPSYAEDFYEVCRRLCIFYNGKLTYEKNKKGLYTYFARYHSLHYLTDTFPWLMERGIEKGTTFGNASKGVNASTPVKNYTKKLIRDWLLKEKTRTYIKDGVEVEETYAQLYDIRQFCLLQELSKYNLEMNFDRHDALAMLMLNREDIYQLNGGHPERAAERKPPDWSHDNFMTMYDKVMKKKGLVKNKPIIPLE